eukprot:m.263263 g.263263  ORF g.263263 m.263263 type:complete len:110 (+) comp26861_c0_seq1:349-678(+)
MRYVAAYLLCALGGNNSPSEDDIKNILTAAGIEADSERLSKVVSELSGKNIEEVITEGSEKLASVPTGGGVAASTSGNAPAGDAPKEEEKKKKETTEESDDDMGFGLFD